MLKFARFTLPVLLFLCLWTVVTAQHSTTANKPQIPFKDRIFVGGNLGLTFGTITNIEIAPLIGYMLTPSWSAGVAWLNHGGNATHDLPMCPVKSF